MEVFRRSCETIKKGSSVGSRESNHNRMPVLELSNVSFGKKSKKQNKQLMIIKGIVRFNLIPAVGFVKYMWKEIYSVPSKDEVKDLKIFLIILSMMVLKWKAAAYI